MAVSLASLLDRTERWFFAPKPVDALVLARIVMGGVLFSAYLARLPDVQALYGPGGLAGPGWRHPYRAAPGGIDSALASLPAASDGMIWLAYAAILVASLCFTLGFRTRWAGGLLLLLHIFFNRMRLPFADWGWAVQIQPLLFYVICSSAGRLASVDAWLERRRSGGQDDSPARWQASAWPLRLLQIHTCTMYLVAGGNRLDDPGWISGQAVWIAVTRAEFSRFIYDWHSLKPLLALATWGTWLLEPSAPLLLWVKRVGPWIAYALMAMHLGLQVLTLVGYWNYLMMVSLCAFLPAAHVRALVARLPGAGQPPRMLG